MNDTATATTEGTPETAENTHSVNAGTTAGNGNAVNTGTSPATSEGAVNTTDASSTDNQGRAFTQAEVDRIVKERLEKERKTAEKKAEETRLEIERKAAEEQGKFKELYEAEKARAEKAEQERQQIERARLIDRIAAELGIPEPLRDRIKGETEDELRADATEVAKFIAPGKREPPLTESQHSGRNDAILGADEMAQVARQMGLKLPATAQ